MIALEQPRKLERVRMGGVVWLRLDYPEAAYLRPVLENPDSYLEDRSRHLKNTKSVTIASVPVEGHTFVLRRLNYGKRVIHKVRDFFRASRVVRALKSAEALRRAGIRTPPAYAAATIRRLRWPVKAYLVTRMVQNTVTVRSLLSGRLPRKLVAEMVLTMAALHNAGFSHRDLKLTNVLVDPDGLPHLIDMDGVRGFRRVPLTRALKDIVPMWKELRKDWLHHRQAGLRFWIGYCRQRRLPVRETGGRLAALTGS